MVFLLLNGFNFVCLCREVLVLKELSVLLLIELVLTGVTVAIAITSLAHSVVTYEFKFIIIIIFL